MTFPGFRVGRWAGWHRLRWANREEAVDEEFLRRMTRAVGIKLWPWVGEPAVFGAGGDDFGPAGAQVAPTPEGAALRNGSGLPSCLRGG